MKTLWVDILCWESAVRLIAICKTGQVEKVYYLNRANWFPCRAVHFLQKIIRKPLVQADQFAQADERIGGTSLFELIYLKMAAWAEEFVQRLDIAHPGDNSAKLMPHIQEALCGHFFKVSELMYFAKNISGDDHSLYLLKAGFTEKFLHEALGADNVHFYRAWFGLRGGIKQRLEYLWDEVYNKIYASDRLDLIARLWGRWLGVLLNIILVNVTPGRKIKDVSPVSGDALIGVEFIQSRVKLDAINDIYWLRDSGIDPRIVCGIEFEEYLDEESSQAFSSLSIARFKPYRSPLKFITQIFRSSAANPYKIAVPGFVDWIRNFSHLTSAILSLFSEAGKGWAWYEQLNFKVWVNYWQSIYSQLGVRVLWSMYDIDPEKLIKAQALENLNSLFAGSHWSYFPMVCAANDRKCYDVFFTWGPYSPKNVFVKDSWLGMFYTGYPLDFYFDKYRDEAAQLRREHSGKFILTYLDNVVSNDFSASRKMRRALHQMLVDLLKKYEHLVVFLKPKRNHALAEAIAELPQIGEFIRQGRIFAFLGDSPRTKAIPAKVGMASDLVVGMGIGTAAMECAFAGAVSFHADLLNFQNNEFAEKSEGTVTFRDIQSLQEAVESFIDGRKRLTAEDRRKFYEHIEPFQDGKAYQRTGFILNRLQKGFQKGLNRQEAVDLARSEYEESLAVTAKG